MVSARGIARPQLPGSVPWRGPHILEKAGVISGEPGVRLVSRAAEKDGISFCLLEMQTFVIVTHVNSIEVCFNLGCIGTLHLWCRGKSNVLGQARQY